MVPGEEDELWEENVVGSGDGVRSLYLLRVVDAVPEEEVLGENQEDHEDPVEEGDSVGITVGCLVLLPKKYPAKEPKPNPDQNPCLLVELGVDDVVESPELSTSGYILVYSVLNPGGGGAVGVSLPGYGGGGS